MLHLLLGLGSSVGLRLDFRLELVSESSWLSKLTLEDRVVSSAFGRVSGFHQVKIASTEDIDMVDIFVANEKNDSFE